jgi:nucleoside-diphosphate-sugar epimerase
MRAFMTGATGFLGGRVAKKLRERGDEVVCLVRNPGKAGDLRGLGCELVAGDLSATDAMRDGMKGCDAVFHLAADYRIGIPKSEVPGMEDANVGGTRRVLDAAGEAGVAKVVYVSTLAAYGNTGGKVVDESYRHPGDRFGSVYERTKKEAHDLAMDRAAAGLPVVVVQPGSIYGPGDTSESGKQLQQAATGKLPAVAFGESGLTWCFVDDVADGVIAAYDKGRVGESYNLGGERTTMAEAIERAARAGGVKPPKRKMPAGVIKAMVPIAPVFTKLMKLPPNLRETISSIDGVTYWASHDKAASELGYQPRDLDEGLRQTFAPS